MGRDESDVLGKPSLALLNTDTTSTTYCVMDRTSPIPSVATIRPSSSSQMFRRDPRILIIQTGCRYETVVGTDEKHSLTERRAVESGPISKISAGM